MDPIPRIDRRTALKWMLAAIASLALTTRPAQGQAAVPTGRRYGTDPDLLKTYRPGELWPLTFTEAQRHTAAALCDMIIPADAESPSASSLGVVDFIDEWISAPYPDQNRDRAVVLFGLTWLEAEAARRFARDFASSSEGQKAAICDDLCSTGKAAPAFKEPAQFFSLYRNLTAGGFYTTPPGRQDLRYVGNVPLAVFAGPPPEVLRQAGLV
jgi:hypothetical protein